jgi:hypothetical protein
MTAAMTAPVRSGVMVRVALTAVLAVLAATLVLLTPVDAAPRTCFWTVPDDPNAVNVAYPDTGGSYWGGMAGIPPGGALEIKGDYPHARYFSFNAYDAAARPVDALADVEVVPDEGSSNPFLPGADRTVDNRSYTLRAVAGARPEGEDWQPGVGVASMPERAAQVGVDLTWDATTDGGRVDVVLPML